VEGRHSVNDLISRAAAIDAIVSVTAFPDADYIKNLCQNPANSEDWLGGVCDAINAVEDVNAVDAVPVRHGRWINYPECLRYESAYCEEDIVCSECHSVWNIIDNDADRFDYCPACGAKMDGDTNG